MSATCNHALDTDNLCVYRCPLSMAALHAAIFSREVTMSDNTQTPYQNEEPMDKEPVECINCGVENCEDALCRADDELVEEDGDRTARDYADYDDNMTDVEADADTLRSCGWGTDEDYGYYGDD